MMKISPIRSLQYLIIPLTRPRSNGKTLPILTLYTKEDCQLCDEALEVLRPYRHRFHLEEVNIKDKANKDWFHKYRYDIPVFHFNGKFLMKHKADLSVFEEALRQFELQDNKS